MTNWKDVIERAIWTAVQSAVSVVTVVPLITDVEGWQAAGVAAASAAAASLLSFLKTLAQERLSVPETRATEYRP